MGLLAQLLFNQSAGMKLLKPQLRVHVNLLPYLVNLRLYVCYQFL